jgi:GNAT superfamily N-acetyltransferase
MIIRKYQQADEAEVVALWNTVLWADKISPEFFREKILLDPNFGEDGVFVAEEGMHILGAAVTFVCRTENNPWKQGAVADSKDKGSLLPVLCVDKKIADRLIGAAEAYLKECGRKIVSVCQHSPFFFPNSIDRKSYPEIYQFFIDNGYKPTGTSYSMGRDLRHYQYPEEARAMEEKFRGEGITFATYHPRHLLAVKRYMLAECPGWMADFAIKICRQNPEHEIMLAFKNSDVVGYCQYNFCGEQLERVGPFSVAQSMRGKNIGQVMTARLLQTMSEHKIQFAYFGSTGNRQLPFYTKNGFEVFREKTPLEKTLP